MVREAFFLTDREGETCPRQAELLSNPLDALMNPCSVGEAGSVKGKAAPKDGPERYRLAASSVAATAPS